MTVLASRIKRAVILGGGSAALIATGLVLPGVANATGTAPQTTQHCYKTETYTVKVPRTIVVRDPYTVTIQVPYTVVDHQPYTVKEWVPYTVTIKVPVQVKYKVWVDDPRHHDPRFGHNEWQTKTVYQDKVVTKYKVVSIVKYKDVKVTKYKDVQVTKYRVSTKTVYDPVTKTRQVEVPCKPSDPGHWQNHAS